MRTVFISDVTGKQYDSEEECKKAEEAVSTEKLERKEAAKKVDEKLATYNKARKEALDELDKFNQKYGAFKTGISDGDLFFDTPFDWFIKNVFKTF